jgi:hypothetical protein
MQGYLRARTTPSNLANNSDSHDELNGPYIETGNNARRTLETQSNRDCNPDVSKKHGSSYNAGTNITMIAHRDPPDTT